MELKTMHGLIGNAFWEIKCFHPVTSESGKYEVRAA